MPRGTSTTPYRPQLFRRWGGPVSQLLTGIPFGTEADAEQFTTVVSEATVHYRTQAFCGEALVVECRVGWMSRSAFGLEYRVVSRAPAGGRRVRWPMEPPSTCDGTSRPGV